MMNNYKIFAGPSPIKAWINGVELEDSAKQQLLNVASMPFIHSHIAVMPDVHWGIGATVGSVIPTLKAIIPASVGVDIGCGMMAAETNLTANDLPDSLKGIRDAIENAVPVGRGSHTIDNIPKFIENAWYRELKNDYQLVESRAKKITPRDSPGLQLGTLGGGNHFIEICLDESDRVWIMLHSGSRGIGNRIGTYYISEAKEDMREHIKNLPDANLAYLIEGSKLFEDYVSAVEWSQKYAKINRELMLELVTAALYDSIGKSKPAVLQGIVSCHHNYISREEHFGQYVWVTRKGAVRAKEGDLGIIPGSMGVKSYIVRGKGNPDSFHSCSHGAGRRHSRSKAKELFSKADHELATTGVECRKDEGVIDETPGAYKDIDAVMEAQKDLVDIVHTLKQVVCVKG